MKERNQSSDELQRLMHRMELILQSVGEGIVGFDINAHVTFANRRAAKTIGLEVENLVGRKGHDLTVHCSDDGSVCDGSNCPLEAALKSGREERGENAGFFGPDGSIVRVAYTSAPVYEEGNLVGAVFSFRDISERKRLEKELTQARDEAEAASRAKSVFLANMSHELRTPLNAILGYSEMLQEELREDGNEALARDAARIEIAGKRLQAMITDLLDIAKLESGRLIATAEPVELGGFLRELSTAAAEGFAEKGNRLEIRHGIQREVIADPSLLRRVLTSMLDHANRVCSGGVATLMVSEDPGAGTAFGVTMQSETMSEEQTNALFDAFTSGQSARSFDGAGVGLALSRRLAVAIGGSLRVQAGAGGGAEFVLRIPNIEGRASMSEEVNR